jgi:hypothetical protein
MRYRSENVILTPREFGAIIVADGEMHQLPMTPTQQLDMASRFIEIAVARMRDDAEKEAVESI